MDQIMDLGSLDWKTLVYIFVLAAETYITGTKKGAERKEWVIDKFYSALPKIVTQFITKEQVSDYVETAVTMMKEHLAEEVKA